MYSMPTPRRRRVQISPIFLAVVVVAVVGAVLAWPDSGNARTAQFGIFLMVVAGWVVTLCLHEFGHAYAAYRAGDSSVEAAGYLTLNPLKYAHPLLSIVLPLLFIVLGGIGLPGGAVYLHTNSFRTRAQRSLAAAAGPAANVVFGVVILLICHGHQYSFTNLAGGTQPVDHSRFWAGLAFLGFLQLSAAFLNLLPIPGLDGYGIIEPYLSAETRRPLEQVKPYGLLGLYVLLQIGRLNTWFFDVVEWLYNRTGAPADLWQIGHDLFQFWHTSPF